MTPQPAPPTGGKTPTAVILLVVLVGGLFACAIFGILAAIAIPSFVRYQSKAKQSEGRVAIKGVDIAERAYFAEHDAYSSDVTELGLQAGTRYTCSVTGVTGDCPECEYTAVCTGNIDNDETLDTWSVSSADRACGKAGVPCNDVNDTEQ
ncbi:MAG: type IV pilin protein [Archangium sp.]